MNDLWRLWAKALGEKAGNSDKEADHIAMIRTALIIFTLSSTIFGFITNMFIISCKKTPPFTEGMNCRL